MKYEKKELQIRTIKQMLITMNGMQNFWETISGLYDIKTRNESCETQ